MGGSTVHPPRSESPEDLRPVDGHMVWIYVFYAWANPNGTWRTAGEFITRYTELSGYQRDYCEV